jgi:type II secretory pathway pseudopilin PulG
LIEILMSLVLVAILVTVAIPMFYNFGNDARIAVTRDRMNSIRTAILGDARYVTAGQMTRLGYEANCLGLPSTLTDLVTQPVAGTCAATYNPFNQQGWRGPYLSTTDNTWNRDAWGTAFVYFSAGPPARTLRSCGPDLTCGTSDDINLTF